MGISDQIYLREQEVKKAIELLQDAKREVVVNKCQYPAALLSTLNAVTDILANLETE